MFGTFLGKSSQPNTPREMILDSDGQDPLHDDTVRVSLGGALHINEVNLNPVLVLFRMNSGFRCQLQGFTKPARVEESFQSTS